MISGIDRVASGSGSRSKKLETYELYELIVVSRDGIKLARKMAAFSIMVICLGGSSV